MTNKIARDMRIDPRIRAYFEYQPSMAQGDVDSARLAGGSQQRAGVRDEGTILGTEIVVPLCLKTSRDAAVSIADFCRNGW